MKNMIARFINEEAGQDLIEYALLAGFISLACVGAIVTLGGSVNTLYGKVGTKLGEAGTTP